MKLGDDVDTQEHVIFCNTTVACAKKESRMRLHQLRCTKNKETMAMKKFHAVAVGLVTSTDADVTISGGDGLSAGSRFRF